jgi:hypothetical protein
MQEPQSAVKHQDTGLKILSVFVLQQLATLLNFLDTGFCAVDSLVNGRWETSWSGTVRTSPTIWRTIQRRRMDTSLADTGLGLFLSSLFFGHQQGLYDVPRRSAIAHQLPQRDCGFHRQKYFDSPVTAGLLLCPALSGLWSLDASAGQARMGAIGASTLLLSRGCSQRMLGSFHGGVS